MKRLNLLSLLIIITIFSCNYDDSDVVESTPPAILTFAVEHYEIVATESDTAIHLFLNRNLKKEELIDFRLDIEHEGQLVYGVFPFGQKNMTDNILRLDFPCQDTSYTNMFPDISPNGKFSALVRAQLKTGFHFDHFDVKVANSNLPPDQFRNGRKIYHLDHALSYQPSDTIDSLVSRSEFGFNNYTSLFKNYEGEWDSNGQKQGRWNWHYTSGRLMATGEFNDDTLIAPFKFYYYSGKLLDSISYSYMNGKKTESKQRYYRNGQLQSDKGYKYRIEYNPDGEVTSYSDTRNCNSCDISKLDEIKFTTLDGRNYLIIDSLETIQLSENIRPFLNCINRCEYSGGLDFMTLPTSWEANTPIQVKATLPGVLFLDIDISAKDTTVTRTIDFTVEGVH